ncbi:MAG TPA: hypothetical protein VJX67_11925, partial [Blastocatellia bacterium]|nr:hypothetical protein [Blastocatellia bacterium]
GERCFLMFDGLDEVGGKEERARLLADVIGPLLRGTKGRTLLTSRIVGYDEAPIEEVSRTYYGRVPAPGVLELVPRLPVRRYYVAPFNPDDTNKFIVKWYSAREPDPELRREGIISLSSVIAQNNRIGRLASNPSLLTMIALIHRVTAHLPSGRVKLYDKIVEAYLETIQTYRKLGRYSASLDQMKRWLSWVGWNMQGKRESENEDSTLLVSRQVLLKWLAEVIGRERDGAEEEAGEFLDFVKRRSGLLLERGPDEFAFVHLTFQEYFAAFYLRGMVGRFDKLTGECVRLAGSPLWHETLNLLFEMLAEFPGAGDDLLNSVTQCVGAADLEDKAARLFAGLALDEESGLSLDRRKRAVYFALTAASSTYDYDVIGLLRRLPEARLEAWVQAWFTEELEHLRTQQPPRYFFFVGAYLLGDWAQRLADWIGTGEAEHLGVDRASEVALLAQGHPEVLKWAVSKLPVSYWVRPFSSGVAGRTISLADSLATNPASIWQAEPIWHFLSQLGRLRTLGVLLLVRQAVLATILPDGQRRPVEELNLDAFIGHGVAPFAPDSFFLSNPYLAVTEEAVQLTIFSAARVDRVVPEIRKEWGLNLSRALGYRLAARYVIQERDEGFLKGLGPLLSEAISLSLAPNGPCAEFEFAVRELQGLAGSADDWSRLVASTTLLALGRGTPALCARRAELLAKGTNKAMAFTFPDGFRAETETAEFRNDLPEILGNTFYYDSGRPWPSPEWFDASNPGARFFLSTPREFYSVAAEVLDPEGITELSKWRLDRPEGTAEDALDDPPTAQPRRVR